MSDCVSVVFVGIQRKHNYFNDLVNYFNLNNEHAENVISKNNILWSNTNGRSFKICFVNKYFFGNNCDIIFINSEVQEKRAIEIVNGKAVIIEDNTPSSIINILEYFVNIDTLSNSD